MKPAKLSEVKKWLKAVGSLDQGQKISINEAGEVDVKGNIALANDLTTEGFGEITNIPFQFGTIEGSFEVLQTSLKSLKSFPHTVIGDVVFATHEWENLEHGPKHVTEHYSCFDCGLKTLHGAPEKVQSFYCGDNKLTNLDGLPQFIAENFSCRVIDMPKILELRDVPPPPEDKTLDYPEDQIWTISGREIVAIKKAFDEAKALTTLIEPIQETELEAKARFKRQSGM